jgi:hypothetical protein
MLIPPVRVRRATLHRPGYPVSSHASGGALTVAEVVQTRKERAGSGVTQPCNSPEKEPRRRLEETMRQSRKRGLPRNLMDDA